MGLGGGGALMVVSWCWGRVQSPNDIIQKREKTLNGAHTTIQYAICNQQWFLQHQEMPVVTQK